jgi:hypothetical protein
LNFGKVKRPFQTSVYYDTAMTLLRVPALLFTPVREVVHARPVTRPLPLKPIVGLWLLLNGRLGGERAAHFLVLGRVFVGLRLRVVVVGDAHSVRI